MLLFETEVKPKVKTAKIIEDKTTLIIDSYKNDFVNYCAKLKKSGCNSSDKAWWRFRFYEFLKCDEQSKTDVIWQEKTEKYHTWDAFWSKYWKEIIDKRWHSSYISEANASEDDLDDNFDY